MVHGDIIKILLVQPFIFPPMRTLFGKIVYSYFRKISFFDSYLALQQVAAVTPRKHEISFIDERFEDIEFDDKYDLVGITCTTGLAPRAYEIAEEFKKRKIAVVMGGPHVSFLPEEAKKHADSVVIGEAEGTWPQLLKDFENNNLKPFYKQEKPVDPNLIPPARRDITKGFLPLARVQATRGCPYKCNFCLVPYFEGEKLRKRPVDKVIDEIKSIKQKFLIFSDGSLTIDPEYTKSLFKEMHGLNKKFACFGNQEVLNSDEELLRLSKKAGCVMWHVGFESISQDTLNSIGKNTNTVEHYASTVKKIHENKMAVAGAFIFGFDMDTYEVFDKTLKAALEFGLDLFEINILTPFPGTPLFERLEKEGRILTKEWYHYKEGQSGTKVVFQPKNISVAEMRENIDRLFWIWLSTPLSVKRLSRTMRYGLYPCIYTLFSSRFFI